jgi:hypothetical protein
MTKVNAVTKQTKKPRQIIFGGAFLMLSKLSLFFAIQLKRQLLG